MITHYFGTSTIDYGHYLREINESGTSFISKTTYFKSFPFSPESITENLKNGEVNWQYHKSPLGEFTVCAIAGSCKDTRPGSKSVFIVKEVISFEEMKNRILHTPVCKEIIDKMPFEIKW